MSINASHQFPVLVVTNGIKTDGHISDLGPGQLGLYSRYNSSVVKTPGSREEVYFAFGSTRTHNRIGDVSGYKLPEKSSFFKIKDVQNFEISNPSKVLLSNKMAIGYTGAGSGTSINFVCGKNYIIKVILSGSPFLRYWGKPMEKTIGYYTGDCVSADCISCPENRLDPEYHAKQIVDLINNEVELKQSGVKARYISDTYVAPSDTRNIYSITITDDGSVTALQAAQATVSAVANATPVTRTGRIGLQSTYGYCGDAAGANYVPVLPIALAVCGTCPTGFTLVAAKDVYSVSRPIAEGTLLTTDAQKATFLAAVIADYSGAVEGVFEGYDTAAATVQFKVPKDATVTKVKADRVTKGITIEDQCTPNASATPVAWAQTGTGYKVKRKLQITLNRTECNAAVRTSELTAYYAGNPEVATAPVIVSGSNGCEDTYTIEQWSKGCVDGDCLAIGSFEYNDFGSFGGVRWAEVPPTAGTPNYTRKVGISVEVVIPEFFFKDDSYSMNDFYEDEPPHVELGWEIQYPTTFDLKGIPTIKQIRAPKFLRQRGDAIRKQLIAWSAYHWANQWNDEPRMREIFGQNILEQIQLDQFYKIYYIKFVESRPAVNTFGTEPHVFEPLIIFKDSDPRAADFEKMFATALATTDIVLNDRFDMV